MMQQKRSLILGKIDSDIIPSKLTQEKIQDINNLFIINHLRFAVATIGAVGSDYKDNSNKRYSKLEVGVPIKYLAYLVMASFNGCKCKEFIIYITRQDDKSVVWNYRIKMQYCYIVETTTIPGAQYARLVRNQGIDTEQLFINLRALDGPQSKPESTWVQYRSNSASVADESVEEPMVVFSVIYSKLVMEAKTSKTSKKGVIGAVIER